MSAHNITHEALHLFKTQVCDPFKLVLTSLQEEDESREYGACRFLLNGKHVVFRVSKITPTKTGQFVTIWKRNEEGITQPFHANDEVDFMVIFSRTEEHSGLFIFPKSVLDEKGLLSSDHKEGKRGTRVYPPWDKAMNKQAEKTQAWQSAYFVQAEENGTGMEQAEKLLLQAKVM